MYGPGLLPGDADDPREPLTDAVPVHVGHDVNNCACRPERVRARLWRRRLRSVKNSGGEAEGNPDHVLHLLDGNAEVASDLGEAVAGLEAIDEILDPDAAVHVERLTKRLAGSTVTAARAYAGSRRRSAQPSSPYVIGLRYSRMICAKCC